MKAIEEDEEGGEGEGGEDKEGGEPKEDKLTMVEVD